MKLPTWMPSEEVDAQAAHVGWGLAIVLWGGVWGLGPWWTAAALVAWIVGKEYGFDLAIERDSAASSTVDAAFYVVGGLIGAAVWWWR